MIFLSWFKSFIIILFLKQIAIWQHSILLEGKQYITPRREIYPYFPTKGLRIFNY